MFLFVKVLIYILRSFRFKLCLILVSIFAGVTPSFLLLIKRILKLLTHPFLIVWFSLLLITTAKVLGISITDKLSTFTLIPFIKVSCNDFFKHCVRFIISSLSEVPPFIMHILTSGWDASSDLNHAEIFILCVPTGAF